MRLLNVRLKNVCQHEDLELNFQSGLIGIFGPNGSGKSNAINAGPYAALTNDYSRVMGGKVGAVRQQAEPQDLSEIFLRAEHNGTTFEILRRLQPSSKHMLASSVLSEKLTKAREIQEWLEGTLGLERALIDDYLFVGQRELTAFLSDSGTVRAKSLSRLCKTMHSELCWEALGKQIEKDRPLASQVIDTTDAIRERISHYKAELKKAVAEKKEARRQEPTAVVQQAAHTTVKQREKYETAETVDKPKAVAKEAELLQQTREAFSQVKELDKEVARLQKALKAAEEAAAGAEESIRTYTASKKRWGQRVSREQKLAELLKKEFKEPEAPRLRPKQELTEEWSELHVNIRQWKKWIETSKSGLTACEECGSDLTAEKMRERIVEYQDKLPKAEEKERILLVARQRWNDHEAEVKKIATERQVHGELVENAQAAVEEYCEVEEPEKIDQEGLQGLLDERMDAWRQVFGHEDDEDDEGILGRLKVANELKSVRKGGHRAAKERLKEIAEVLRENKVTDKQVEQAKATIAAVAAAKERFAVAKALAKTAADSLQEREEELERVEALLSRSTRARDWMQLQEGMRGILHRDRLPRRVHRRALQRMENGVNETLELFDSPFWVRTDDELRFVAHKPNGTVMPGEGLSGGEQSVLSLAFRWTLNSMFASQIGMLVLDEPTAWLDARNLDCLEAALTNLRGLVQAQGYQVIIITHQLPLKRVFDQVITLE